MSKLILVWLSLLLLLAVEVGASFLRIGPLVLLPALAMLTVVVAAFMQVGRGPTVIRLFAAAGLLWLIILLTLGSLDPLTRINYAVEHFSTESPP